MKRKLFKYFSVVKGLRSFWLKILVVEMFSFDSNEFSFG